MNTYVAQCATKRRKVLLTSVNSGYSEYEGWNFNSGNYLFTTDTK